MEAQVRRVFDNLKAIVAAAGGDLLASQSSTCSSPISALSARQQGHGGVLQQPYPARAAVGVAALPRGARSRSTASSSSRSPGARGAQRRSTSAGVGPTTASPLAARPVTSLRGVGPALADNLARLGMTPCRTCCSSCRCATRTARASCPIGSLRAGERAVVEGEVQLTEVAFRGRRLLLSRIADGSGSLTLRFFHFSAAQQAALARGTRLRCFGEVRAGPSGLEIVHPEYRRASWTHPRPQPRG